MKRVLCRTLLLFVLTLPGPSANADSVVGSLAYPLPSGGWTYIYNGDQAATNSAVGFSTLDGTWDHNNGSDAWDIGAPIGGTISSANKPGGVMTVTNAGHASENNVTYLRIQDAGRSPNYSGLTNNGCDGCSLADPSNRKFAFFHNMTAEGCPSAVLDDGFTFTFRARVPTPAKTTAPLDPIYPANETANGPQPYPAGGDGDRIVPGDNGYGYFTIRQLSSGRIGFSLTVSNDLAIGFTNTVGRANYQGLTMNALNGNVLNNNIDLGEGGTVNPQFLSLDPTEWNEFWIVLKKDDTGLGTHVAFVYTNGSLHAQVFHLTAATASEGNYSSMSSFAIAMPNSDESGTLDVDFLAYRFDAQFPPGASGEPPVISGVSPTPPPQGNLFWPATNGVSFTASSSASAIPTAGIKLVLNGVDVSSALNITGTSTNRSVTYTGLVDNAIYAGLITVTNSGGEPTTFPLKFDTFTEITSVVIEGEDYNHDSGQFVDHPAPNGYSAFTGTPEVDFRDVTPQNIPAVHHYYGRADAVATDFSTDTARQKYGGANDYDVSYVEQGEWLNYTRTFPAGKYNVYLRCASQAAQSVRLDLVTGPTNNQATSFLGTFPLPNTGTTHTYARLSDAFGNPLVIKLSGIQTVRLTAPQASADLLLNYLVFAPAGAVTNPPVVGFASPGPNSTSLLPDAPIQIGIVNDEPVDTNSINLQFDSSDVTASATISSNAAGAFVAYKPPSQLTLNSMHTIRLFFSDTGARTFTNQWTFRVADLPVLRAAWVTPPGSGLSNGFNIIVNKVDREAQQQLFPNTASRAESQIDPGIPNPSPPPLYYPNQAAGPNGDGSSAELNVINYNGDGTDRGAFTGDQPLPNIPPAPDLRHIAMAVTAYVELSAGLHRFGVRRDDGFKLLAGPDFTRADATLTLGAFEPNLVDSTTATTEFDFMVESSGVYAVRLVFFENRGGSDGPDIEWYSVDRATGATTLINDTNSTAVKAYMARTGAPINNFQLLNPSLSGGNFSFSYPTVTGHQYYVEYKNSLTDAVWQTQPAVAGNGTTQSFSVPISTAASRFYRVRAQ